MYEFKDFSDFSSEAELLSAWSDVVLRSDNSWFWSSSEFFQYQKKCLDDKNIEYKDFSFFIVCNGSYVGLCLLLISRVSYSGVSFWEGGGAMGALPWPCLSVSSEEYEELEDSIFEEAERRLYLFGASAVKFSLSPPGMAGAQELLYEKSLDNLVLKRSYFDSSYNSHFMTIDGASLDSVRSRYRRYFNKYIKKYNVYSVSGQLVTDELVEKYSELHAKDAGRVVRGTGTFYEQARMAREGMGFWMVAQEKDTSNIVGILQINSFKGHCYDASVAIDPEYQNDQISHLLKWRVIEKLLAENIISYELGVKYELPNLMEQMTLKNKGISFFKEGWSRDGVKRVRVAHKVFDRKYLESYMNEKTSMACDYLGLV